MTKQATLLFLRKDNQILLAMKKRGFGVGKWNGVGGKVESQETIEQAAIRECQEEIGVTPTALCKQGVVMFYDTEDSDFEQEVHIYLVTAWQGEPVESEEMKPQWFGIDAIPYSQMWPDDPLWLPHVLNRQFFDATITLEGDKGVAEHQMRTAPTAAELDLA